MFAGDVWTWGRGEHGQLGQRGKPFVMPPTKSVELSSDSNRRIIAIRAEDNCTGVFYQERNYNGDNKNDRSVASIPLASVGRCSEEMLERWRSQMRAQFTLDGSQ